MNSSYRLSVASGGFAALAFSSRQLYLSHHSRYSSGSVHRRSEAEEPRTESERSERLRTRHEGAYHGTILVRRQVH